MTTLIDYLNYAFVHDSPSDAVMRFFYRQLYGEFNPDINGYTIAIMVPPDLSGYRIRKVGGRSHYDQVNPSSYFGEVAQLVSFAAVDFSPPQSQVNTETISARTGAIPYATEVTESETCSVTYIENADLDIYRFHHLWIEYIREILEGVIAPAPEYITPGSSEFGAIDYAASLYIIKYRPDMRTITFISKCMGIFPQSLPNKELIGARTANEITLLPFTYFCTAYREATALEYDNWILSEIEYIMSRFSLSWHSVLGLAVNALSHVFNTAKGVLGQALSDIITAPSTIITSKMHETALKIATAKGEVVKEVVDDVSGKSAETTVKITESISSFPKKFNF